MSSAPDISSWKAFVRQHYQGQIDNIDLFCATYFAPGFYFRSNGMIYPLDEVKFWLRSMRSLLKYEVLHIPFVQITDTHVATILYQTLLETNEETTAQLRVEISLNGIFDAESGRLLCLNEVKRTMEDKETMWTPLEGSGVA